MKLPFAIGLFCTALIITSTAQSACNPALPMVTPDTQFTLDNQAIVFDTKTGLRWLRCTPGQSWNTLSNQCLNDNTQPFFTWEEALAAANRHDFGGFTNWRLPNKKELASLLDQSCISPTINSQIFPDTLSAQYWTATPVLYSDKFSAWFVDFNEGGYGIAAGDKTIAVRLVRDAQ